MTIEQLPHGRLHLCDRSLILTKLFLCEMLTCQERELTEKPRARSFTVLTCQGRHTKANPALASFLMLG